MYSYETEKPKLFTDEGQRYFIQCRDRVLGLARGTDAISADKACTQMGVGDGWQQIAVLDRMIELGDLIELPNPQSRWGQHRVFILPSLRP